MLASSQSTSLKDDRGPGGRRGASRESAMSVSSSDAINAAGPALTRPWKLERASTVPDTSASTRRRSAKDSAPAYACAEHHRHQQGVDVHDALALDRATGAGGPTDDGSRRDPRQVADEMFDGSGRHEASW